MTPLHATRTNEEANVKVVSATRQNSPNDPLELVIAKTTDGQEQVELAIVRDPNELLRFLAEQRWISGNFKVPQDQFDQLAVQVIHVTPQNSPNDPLTMAFMVTQKNQQQHVIAEISNSFELYNWLGESGALKAGSSSQSRRYSTSRQAA